MYVHFFMYVQDCSCRCQRPSAEEKNDVILAKCLSWTQQDCTTLVT